MLKILEFFSFTVHYIEESRVKWDENEMEIKFSDFDKKLSWKGEREREEIKISGCGINGEPFFVYIFSDKNFRKLCKNLSDGKVDCVMPKTKQKKNIRESHWCNRMNGSKNSSTKLFVLRILPFNNFQ